ncbi:ProFAR isomerase associated superfamily [Salpingoeca rosetta]|uniref:ProFAR isomerase associated superfamily n=1 Tax=Salpingoeca rosetta (strain ATCC 50818 / BSB-021) TaxID=946362 RepID=F2UIF3_SALR5|nr:ProFAR isomerase associated superfamily [Salpingoeca rosetta]EGD76902.1 ProFAR isomerase associated superfamily [Salpingoeca rosetta]|eukprot:XP_004991273.1 ProFAR isomerase associated superfamily [Salpingoeca rosetta]
MERGERGSEAVAVQEVQVVEPWFSFIAQGKKTVEGRLASDKYTGLGVGCTIAFRCEPTPDLPPVHVTVTRVVRYPSIALYLEAEGLSRCLPGIETLAEGVQVYRQFYTEEDEQRLGVLAIHIQRATDQ